MRADEVVAMTRPSVVEPGRPWRLGQALDLGTWEGANERGIANRDISASSEIASRLLDVSGDQARFDEITWKYSHDQHPGPFDLCATVTSRTHRSGRLESVELVLEAISQDGAPAVQGDGIIAFGEVEPSSSEISDGVTASFASEPWAELLADRLREDPRFAEVTNSYDGSIGLQFGRVTLGLRIYRGRVIDQGHAVFNDATFSIASSTHGWLEFARRPRNEFISFAMADRFSVRGSTYEYLRLTSAVMAATDLVRELIRAELEEI